MAVGGVHRVLQGLLREHVSIRDMAVIVETLADHAARTQEPALLIELCRRALGAHIVRDHLGPDGSLKAIGLHPNLETLIKKSTHRDSAAIGTLSLNPALAREVLKKIEDLTRSLRARGIEPVLLCSPAVRPQVRQLIGYGQRDMTVLSFAEIPDSAQVDIVDMIPPPPGTEAEAILEGAA